MNPTISRMKVYMAARVQYTGHNYDPCRFDARIIDLSVTLIKEYESNLTYTKALEDRLLSLAQMYNGNKRAA